MDIKNHLRWWLYRMNFFKGAKLELPCGIDAVYQDIAQWHDIYSGEPPWLSVPAPTILNGGAKRKISQLKMAKVLCSDITTLIFNEKVVINITSEQYPKIETYFKIIFKSNRFFKNFKQSIETMMADGGMVVKVYYNDGIKLDFVPAQQFMPLKWDNRIRSAIIASQSVSDGCYYTLHEKHSIIDNANYEIENTLYRSKTPNELGVKVDVTVLYDNLNTITPIETAYPLFVYLTPSTNNNIYPEFPLGISIFANAVDTLKLLDIAFDSFQAEFELGQKRIIVPSSAVDIVYDIDGMAHRYFNASNRVYEAMEMEESEKIIDNTVELRVEEHISAINAMLDLLCLQTGLSGGTFSFDGKSVKTATEVISENSKTFRTVQSNENDIKDGLCELVDAIVTVAQLYGELPKGIDYEVSATFDDSIVIDKNADLDNGIKEIGSGIKSKLKFMISHYGYTEQQALEELERIAKEQQIRAEDIDMYGGGA